MFLSCILSRMKKRYFLIIILRKKRRRILFCYFGRPPQRSRQTIKSIFFFLPLIFSERRILKKFPSIPSKKRVGYKKNSKHFSPKRRIKICSLNFHCSKKKKKRKKKRNIYFYSSPEKKKLPLSGNFFSSCVLQRRRNKFLLLPC